MINSKNNNALSGWLSNVLRAQTKGASVVLPDGREASVVWEDGCLLAYTYDENDNPEYHARVRAVEETD
jgi:hypothetical protein